MDKKLDIFSSEVLGVFEEALVAHYRNTSIEEKLKNSIEYSLLNGGKRVRPLLVFLVLNMLNNDYKLGIDAAKAVEFIHTYSLIHDDLPSMDNDDYRRGKLTNHKVYGEAMAILAADALNTDAFNVLANSNYSNDVKVELIKLLSYCAGPQGMVGGQVIDIFSSHSKYTFEELKYLHSLKTGKLIEYSIIAPLYITNKVNLLPTFTKIAQNIGLIFQIQDDILDVVGNQEELGKTIGKDEHLNKSTYVTILGLEESKICLDKLFNETIMLIDSLNLESELFKEFVQFLVTRQR